MGQAEAARLLDMVENDVAAERPARDVGIVERIDQRQAVGEAVGEADREQGPRAWLIADPAPRRDIRSARCRYGCPRPSWRNRATTCRPCRPRGAGRRDRSGKGRSARWSASARQTSPTRSAFARMARRWLSEGRKSIHQHAHRYAGPAALARRPVGDRLRAAKSGLGQEVVEGGGPLADQMGENLPLLLSGQVGARRRSGQIKLWGVARFPAHTVSASPPELVAGAKRPSRHCGPVTNQSLRTITTPAMISCRHRFSAVDQRHSKIGGKTPAHIKQHRLNGRIDERDPRAGVLHAHFEIHRPHAGRRHACGPRR